MTGRVLIVEDDDAIATGLALNLKLAPFEIRSIHVGYLELAPDRRLDLAGNVHHLLIVEVKPGDGIARSGMGGLLLDGHGQPRGIELDHSVGARIVHVIPENCSPSFPP